jgi:Fe-S-cluster containining protein
VSGSRPTAEDGVAAQHPQLELPGLGAAVRQAVALCHGADAHLTRYSYENTVAVRTLTEVLIAKGLIGLTEFEQRKPLVAQQVAQQRANEWSGPQLNPVDPHEEHGEPVRVDCESRLTACEAACCTIFRVFLSASEVRRGELLWDLAQPYQLLKGPDGHCVHLDAETLRCGVWERRPHVCRTYSCASDGRIWDDFERRGVAASLLETRARQRGAAAMADGRA